jgi:hypothetical protein
MKKCARRTRDYSISRMASEFSLTSLWKQRKNPVLLVAVLAFLGMTGYHISYDSSKGLTVQWTKEQQAGVKAVVDATRDYERAKRQEEFRAFIVRTVRSECRKH